MFGGKQGSIVDAEKKWYRRLGIRDAKRVVVLAITMIYLCALWIAISMRREVLVQLSPERMTLYRLDSSGVVYNQFRARVSNRGKTRAQVTFAIEGLPGGRIALDRNPVVVEPGATEERRFDVAAARFPGAQDVNHFRILVRAAPKQEQDTFDETFLMPPEKP